MQGPPAPGVGRRVVTVAATLGLWIASGCGGGGGRGGGSFILSSFTQAGRNDVPLNAVLEFRFSEPPDPASVTPLSLQVQRDVPTGPAVPGEFLFEGARVLWRPRLPGLCDLSDGGLAPGAQYLVQLLGHPEYQPISDATGTPLDRTTRHVFRTRGPSDPNLYDEPAAGPPFALSCTPGEVAGDPGANAAVAVRPAAPPGQPQPPARVVVVVSENLDPCTVSAQTVIFRQFERGDPDLAQALVAPNGRLSGFTPATDASADPFRWGASNAISEPVPRVVPSAIRLVQDYAQTRIEIEPYSQEFPDNALLVVELTFGLLDLNGHALVPAFYSFTTENRPVQTGVRSVLFEGETPIDALQTSAEVDTARAPDVAQGYATFAGDGDNGSNLASPGLPAADSLCTSARQEDDGLQDDFDPTADTILDTGGGNTCPNATDGSRAVVWEFRSLRIRSGVTVRVVGENPAILLVRDGVLIEGGGALLVRGGNGGAGQWGVAAEGAPGRGVAGGADGGTAFGNATGTYPARYGEAGRQGCYHGSDGTPASDVGSRPGSGGGHGNTSAIWHTNTPTPPSNRNGASGGGGGHASAGSAGTALGSGDFPTELDLTPDGAGGGTYGDGTSRMRFPEAGSGGGAAGETRPPAAGFGAAYRSSGGGGGAGGGFLDITCGGDVQILGTIDVSGGHGGNGAMVYTYWTSQPGSAAGGGGSGGGLRVRSAAAIVVGTTAVVTAAGGRGGVGGVSYGDGGISRAPANDGGAGGLGRIALEDADSVIPGLTSAIVVPSEGSPGFYRGVFDPTVIGRTAWTPQAVTRPFYVGPWNPTYAVPAPADLVAGVPHAGSRGVGSTSALIEARAYALEADGTMDADSPTGWYTVGHLKDSGTPGAPTWVASANPQDVALPSGNAGTDLGNLNGRPWIQLRITFYLPYAATQSDPGPYLDDLSLRFQYDQ